MPVLKHLTCNIEWAGSEVALKEYNTAYSDGFVQTYVAIPPISTAFSVHLKSNGYIAPGLAMFVYMDGVYQCNRNRRNLKVPDGTMSRRYTEVDFRVRQKEEKLEDGSFLGKEWRFEKLNIVSGNAQAPRHEALLSFEHLGTIEVVVLRCYPEPVVDILPAATPIVSAGSKTPEPSKQSAKSKKPSEAKEPSKPVSPPSEEDDSLSHFYHDVIGGLFDGACDEPRPLPISMPFGGDGGWDQPNPKQGDGQQWGYTMTNQNEGVYHPVGQPSASAEGSHGRQPPRSRGHAHGRFKGDWKQIGRQGSQELEMPGPSHQRVPSFTSNNKNIPASGGGFMNSPAGSAINVETTKGWSGSQAPSVPGGPAVVINVNQPPPSVAGWGAIPDNPIRITSPADSWATRKTLFDYGAANNGSHNSWNMNAQGQSGNDDWRQESGLGRQNTAWETQSAMKSPAYPPKNPGVTLVNGKWQANGGNNTGFGVSRDQNGADASHQRKPSFATILTNQRMPGGWEPTGNQDSNTFWNANDANAKVQPTDWNGGRNDNSNNAQGRCYGSDSSSNDKAGAWGAENNDQGATASWDNNQPQKWAVETNNNAASTWDNQPNAGNWNQNSTQNNRLNNQQAASATWPAFHNSPAQNSPVPGSPNHQQTSMPGAWGQPVTSPTQEQAPPPPPQPSPPLVTQSYQPPPTAPHHAPAVTHYSVPLIDPSTKSYIKPYWSVLNKPRSPPPEQSNTSRKRSDTSAAAYAYIVDEEPLYSVPEEVAVKTQTSHQVQPGPGAMYLHKLHTPRYMDSMEEPYAVFVFKYRSKDVLENILNTTIFDDPDDEKKRLLTLSKDEIIEQLLAAKASTTNPPPPQTTEQQPTTWGASTSLPQQQDNAGPTNRWNNNAANETKTTAPTGGPDPFADALAQRLAKVSGADAWGASTSPPQQQNNAGPTNRWNNNAASETKTTAPTGGPDPFADALAQRLGKVSGADAYGANENGNGNRNGHGNGHGNGIGIGNAGGWQQNNGSGSWGAAGGGGGQQNNGGASWGAAAAAGGGEHGGARDWNGGGAGGGSGGGAQPDTVW
ncbi:MAG: hypothetical protein M1830_006809 [Pleopsidium flavum]|nr:MAG: hypothetical protein M1830_006809 [Pleopsidium flavum]